MSLSEFGEVLGFLTNGRYREFSVNYLIFEVGASIGAKLTHFTCKNPEMNVVLNLAWPPGFFLMC